MSKPTGFTSYEWRSLAPLLFSTIVALMGAAWSVSLGLHVQVNLGLVHLAKATICPAGWFVCRSQPFVLRTPTTPEQQKHLMAAQQWLRTSQMLSSATPSARLHLSTAQYVQGDRAAAARGVGALAVSLPAGRSPLLAPGRPEHALVRARHHMQRQQWQAAVDDFRQATVLDPHSLQPVDDQDWYRALAGVGLENAAVRLGDPRPPYLAGKYLVLAGDHSAALPWLEAARSHPGSSQLSSMEGAWLDVYLARALQASDQLDQARRVLSEALARTPDFRPALIELLRVAQARGDSVAAQQAEAALQTLGPTYRLGQHAEGFAADAPAHLDTGWTLVGYEVDEQVLEQTSAVDLTLWWEAPSEKAAADGLWRVGHYWLQRQTVRNLFANAGFEWGVDDRGIPAGHAREYYGVPADNLRVVATDLNGEPTQVLAGSTTLSHDRVALVSFPLPVDPGGYYLMAAWLRDSDRLSRVGRLCVERRFGPEIGYYISPDRNRPSQTWIHVADLAPASPDRSPISCSTFLLNINSQDTALWDRVLFARVEVP